MEEKKIVLDGNDTNQKAAFALGAGVGYIEGARDTRNVIAAAGLGTAAVILALQFGEPVVNSVKDKVKNFKEKRRLKKEQKRKAKEERAE